VSVVQLRYALDRVAFARSVGMEPDKWQARLLRSDAERVIINASRQAGKSAVSAIIALHKALYQPGSLSLCLAPSLRQSQELFAKIIVYYRDLGRPVPAESEQRLGLELENRSRIHCLPGSEKSVRGFTADLLILDEAARIDDALYHSVRPMLAVSEGSLMMLSTPYGRRGVFYDVWSKGGEHWERYKIPVTDVPRISQRFIEEERHALPARIFQQEYRCSFEQADGAFFRAEDVERLLVKPGNKYKAIDFGGGLVV